MSHAVTTVSIAMKGSKQNNHGWPDLCLNLAKVDPLCRFALSNAVAHSIFAGRLQAFLLMITGFIDLSATGFVNGGHRSIRGRRD